MRNNVRNYAAAFLDIVPIEKGTGDFCLSLERNI